MREVIPNLHHHKKYAEAFGNIIYRKMKTTGKMFVYSTTTPVSLEPIAEIRENKQSFELYVKGQFMLKRTTIKEILDFVSKHIAGVK